MSLLTSLPSVFRPDPRLDRRFLSNLSTALVFSEKDVSRKVTAVMSDRNQGITTTMDVRPLLDFLPDDMVEQIAKTADRDGIHIPRQLRPLEKLIAVNPQDVVVLNAEELSAYTERRFDKDADLVAG